MKKFLALLMTAVMAIGCLSVTAFAADTEAIEVWIQIEGNSKNYADESFTYEGSNPTITEVLKAFDEANSDITLTIEDSTYGSYLTAVNSEAAASFGGYDGWLIAINRVMCANGMDYETLKDGDELQLFYGDSYTVGIQMPDCDASQIADGILTFTSQDTVYDASYNASIVENPVANLTVKWYTSDTEYSTYTTDDNGQVKISDEDLTYGYHKVYVERFNDDGLTTVLRLPTDFMVGLDAVEVKIPAFADEDADADSGDVTVAVVMLLLICSAAFVTVVTKKESYEK